MTKSSSFIRAKLSNRTNAACSDETVKNNRYHYFLRFDESIGWDWMYGQVRKASREMDIELEIWEIHPSGVQDFEIEVREVNRRKGIDESQRGLTDFEE